MRAIVINRQGRPVAPNVELRDDWPEPVPRPGEVLVRTEASALNHLDLWVGRGVPGRDLDYPRVSGSDGCGRVEAVGDGVDEAWIGRRVVLNASVPRPEAALPGAWPAPTRHVIGEATAGTMAERFVAPAGNLLDAGDVDVIEGAAFGLAHLTAWHMMVTRARLRAGQMVLVTGIGGGVALAALGIARHFGCRVFVTSRHASKIDRARALGAEDGVVDTGEDWSRAVRTMTGRRGVDLCVDSIGAVVHGSCLRSLARGGAFVTCGCTTGPDATTDLARMFWNDLSILGSTMGDMDDFRQVMALLRTAAIRPVVDSVHDAADGAAAFARLESGEQFGKVVIRWS